MILTRRATSIGSRWFADGRPLTDGHSLTSLLQACQTHLSEAIATADDASTGEGGAPLAPIDDHQEIWAAGVTYLRSRNERQAESIAADVYAKVYEADRPELFFKSIGSRAIGPAGKIRIRRDSTWNVPEPELTLVINAFGEIVGYTAGNDVSSRSIEGENPLYLPQAKSYDGSCAVGPGIVLATADQLTELPIRCSIERDGANVFEAEANTNQMKRALPDLVTYLFRETSFPAGVFLMTGTGIVPDQGFTLQADDKVTIRVGELTLVNEVERNL